MVFWWVDLRSQFNPIKLEAHFKALKMCVLTAPFKFMGIPLIDPDKTPRGRVCKPGGGLKLSLAMYAFIREVSQKITRCHHWQMLCNVLGVCNCACSVYGKQKQIQEKRFQFCDKCGQSSSDLILQTDHQWQSVPRKIWRFRFQLKILEIN